jgi:hypothetical protein
MYTIKKSFVSSEGVPFKVGQKVKVENVIGQSMEDLVRIYNSDGYYFVTLKSVANKFITKN